MTQPYGPHIRVVSKPGPVAPFCDIVVRIRDNREPTGWAEIARFNDEDPLAVVNAANAARAARRILLEGE